jgi:hypothetical protein
MSPTSELFYNLFQHKCHIRSKLYTHLLINICITALFNEEKNKHLEIHMKS